MKQCKIISKHIESDSDENEQITGLIPGQPPERMNETVIKQIKKLNEKATRSIERALGNRGEGFDNQSEKREKGQNLTDQFYDILNLFDHLDFKENLEEKQLMLVRKFVELQNEILYRMEIDDDGSEEKRLINILKPTGFYKYIP